MAYNINYYAVGKNVKIKISGKWPEDPEELLRAVFNISKKHILSSLLIDVSHLENEPTPLEDYKTIKMMQQIGFDKIPMIAVVDKEKNKKADEIFEGFSLNTQITIRFFYNEEDASNYINIIH
jgi:hypothetical protein